MADPVASGLNIPSSSSTVDVSIIDTTTKIKGLGVGRFCGPHIEGHDYLGAPAFSFLIQHPQQKRTLVFDLGLSKDWKRNPVLVKIFGNADVAFTVERPVIDILNEGGIASSQIESVIWSHWHFDHTGDLPDFDKSTSLIVGPGFKERILPGYPTNPDNYLLESDLTDRNVVELDFVSSTLRIGRMLALDYFQDGSLYFLDTPGHAIGHICALARVTADPPSFILMGGDAYHHGGMLRPSAYMPLPEQITPHPFTSSQHSCPGHLFESLLRNNNDRQPFYEPASGGAYLDPTEASRTIQKLQEADVRNDILMVAAHDETLLDVVDFFPTKANDLWRRAGSRKRDGNSSWILRRRSGIRAS